MAGENVETISFRPSDLVCSEEIRIVLKDNKIESLEFVGGCPGNLIGIARLVRGMDADSVIRLLSGGKPTSCPDQLAAALKLWKRKKK